MSKIVCEEYYGSSRVVGKKQKKIVQSYDGQLVVSSSTDNFESLSTFFQTVFLPQGYPDSVSADYLQYQIWDTIQAFASSITGSLATERLLIGLGVGQAGASVLGATMTWIFKRGAGMIGQIVFTWIHGKSLDCDAKKWRLFADILNDVAIFLEILAPLLGSLFIFVVCVAGLGKSIVGVAGGATRASLTQHQARNNNLADVAAKDGSQETVVNLMALICSLIIVPVVSGKPLLIWTLFIVFTILHVFANYRAVKCVIMEHLNEQRMHFVSHYFFRHNRLLNPAQANIMEPVLWNLRRSLQITSGVPLSMISKRLTSIPYIISVYTDERYILNVDPESREIRIVYHETADLQDKIKSYFHAELIEFVANSSKETHDEDILELRKLFFLSDFKFIAISKKVADFLFPRFINLLPDSGWRTDHVLVNSDEWKAVW